MGSYRLKYYEALRLHQGVSTHQENSKEYQDVKKMVQMAEYEKSLLVIISKQVLSWIKMVG